MGRRDKNGDTAVYVEENYFRHVDQLERWRQEYEHQQAVEKKLASVSSLAYEPLDYAPLLVQVPWKERPIPNFDDFLEKARIAAESRFFIPIAVQLAILIAAVFALLVSSEALALWIAGTLVLIISSSLYITIHSRKSTIQSVLARTKAEIEQRQEAERQKNEQARMEHERQEGERVKQLEKLLVGDIGAIMLRLDNVLPKMDIPFQFEVDIDIYENIPLVKVWLPSKTIIPVQTSKLHASGRLLYEEKEQRVINKQYLELCAALLVRVVAKVYENIPTFDRGYIWGMSRDYIQNSCLLCATIDRDKLSACQTTTGLAALQKFDAIYNMDTALNITPVDPTLPEGWDNIAPQLIRSLHVKISKTSLV